jgi:hypothetical protein
VAWTSHSLARWVRGLLTAVVVQGRNECLAPASLDAVFTH